MSSYSDWKHGFISDAEYNRECRIEEAMARAEAEKEDHRQYQLEELRKDMDRMILPDGLVISDIFWENDKLVIELEEDEE